MTEDKTHWAVVGGGMMGLAAAWRLAGLGQRVTLLESQAELGGLTSAWQLADVEWDKFYHVTLLSDQTLRQLLSELDLEREIDWVTTRTGFFADGRLHSMSHALEFLLFPPLNLYQKFRLGSTIFFGSRMRNWRRLEQIPVEDWLIRWSGRSTFNRLWQPLLKSKLGDAYRRVSAMFIWAYIDRMYKARRTGMKREMFGYVPGGYRRVVGTLRDRLLARGVRIETSAPVREVVTVAEGNGLAVTFGKPHAVRREVFDRVIMSAPSPVIEEACIDLTGDERQRLMETEYLGVVCTSLLLDRPLGGYYVTNIIDEGCHYLVYLPQYLMADDPGLNESEETIHECCLTTLERMYPDFRRQQVRAIQTARARYVMALPTLNYSERRPPVVCSVPGLYLLNNARIVKGNLNVNETLEVLEEDFRDDVWPNHLTLQRSSRTAMTVG